MKRIAIPFLLVALAAMSSPASAAPLYANNFDTDTTANWTALGSTGVDFIADFYYDYSAIGVPAAPGGTSTRGLKLTANNSAGVFGGVSASPNGQSFTGNYTIKFNLWQNYHGPLGPGGSGTTQLSTYGFGTTGTAAAWPGASPQNRVMFGHTLDGGAAADYRAYSSAAPTSYSSGNAVYAAPSGAINESNPYYQTAFPSVSAPAAQVGLFPSQTGSTSPGETAFQWREVEVDVRDGFATWKIDGTLIATINLSTVTLGGSNIFFGHADTNAGSSTDANDSLLNITLIDNVQVIPEPSSFAIAGAAVLGLVALRRRSR